MPISPQLELAFRDRFGTRPVTCVRAPGRVNLMGEHTDYNDGFVMPVAIDRAITIALRPRTDRLVTVHSLDYQQSVTFSLDDLQRGERGWAAYVIGVAWALQSAGSALLGWEGILSGDIPKGAGLSSSAALELATARAFAAISGLAWDPARMARLGQQAENQWVGVQCGIMDQMASAAGRAGHALFLDCRSLEYRHIPMPAGIAIAVLDTGTRRGLVDSAYNERRQQCELAARTLGVRALRDIDTAAFKVRATELEPLTRRRARHIIRDNARVLQAIQAMQADDAGTLGQLLNASHASLRDDFEVSSEALNAIVEAAQRQEECFGARMTGAGFGGCAVALVETGQASRFAEQVAAEYIHQTGLNPQIFVCQTADGANILPA
ncbi:MAG: galactokinase [Anaerolineales bacterium]|nr:galactokinase [Anaerolineales bacterium]